MSEENYVIDKKDILRNLSIQDFKNFGLQQIAYIKTVNNGDEVIYHVYSANGEIISALSSLDEAIIKTRQGNLEPVTVH